MSANEGKEEARAKQSGPRAAAYVHETVKSPMRPEVGTQSQFRKSKAPAKYRFDSSLSPSMEWDDNPARGEGEALIQAILDSETIEDAKDAAQKLRAISKPFLNWAGKAERAAFEVPTLPLFVHERLSTAAILETLKGHRKQGQLDLFGDPQHSITDQLLKAYEHSDKWVNRLILGDSLVVMNSLLQFENMGGEVQMVYMDPPYGIKYGSNFQPFVRSRDVKHNEDESFSREPEMVQAYRDTWTLGSHSWLTYLRDRLLLAKELLSSKGSLFLQINDENLNLAAEAIADVFGRENICSIITVVKSSGLGASLLPRQCDYLIWVAKEIDHVRYRQLFKTKSFAEGGASAYSHVLLSDGSRRRLTTDEKEGKEQLPDGARIFRYGDLTKPGPGSRYTVEYQGRQYDPGRRWWGVPPEGMQALIDAGRIEATENSLSFIRYLDDFPAYPLTNVWTDTGTGSGLDKVYVVQTDTKIVERCVLMTTDPGDLVLDPTCGSGTTAVVSECWGRRWITTDVSRVPLSLARQRLLTETFDYYDLQDESRGPSSGFVFLPEGESGRKEPGVLEHVTAGTISNGEPPYQEILVDRPEVKKKTVRVCGPMAVEATIPIPMNWDDDASASTSDTESASDFLGRMVQTLKASPLLRFPNNRTVELMGVRPIAKSLTLHAEASVKSSAVGQSPTIADVVDEAAEASGQMLDGMSNKPVAILFGPENGAVSERMIYEAAIEAKAKNFTHLYVIGFSIQPNARLLVDRCEEAIGIPATWVEAARDLMMGDLLKNMRSSQLFSVCGMPEANLFKLDDGKYQVQLLGLDTFDAATNDVDELDANDVPAWFLDTDYNGNVFHVCQAFFPRTSAWDNLKKALKTEFSDSLWSHLSGTTSEPFELGDTGSVAIKVIDDRGNELMLVKPLSEAVPKK